MDINKFQMIVGLLPYSERLDLLELTTLVERRARGDLIEVYKAKHGFNKLNGLESQNQIYYHL